MLCLLEVPLYYTLSFITMFSLDHMTIIFASHDGHPLSRKLLLCRVTLGKPVEHYTAVRIAHAPPGHHSVIGRPSAGGLNYPEYVIYRGEQVSEWIAV